MVAVAVENCQRATDDDRCERHVDCSHVIMQYASVSSSAAAAITSKRRLRLVSSLSTAAEVVSRSPTADAMFSKSPSTISASRSYAVHSGLQCFNSSVAEVISRPPRHTVVDVSTSR